MSRNKLLSALLAALLILGIAAPGAAEVNKSTHPLVDPQELVPGRSADDVVNILLLGSPVILAGLLLLFIIEKIKGRSYRIPGEGRQSARQKQKAREQIEQISTETSEGEEKP